LNRLICVEVANLIKINSNFKIIVKKVYPEASEFDFGQNLLLLRL